MKFLYSREEPFGCWVLFHSPAIIINLIKVGIDNRYKIRDNSSILSKQVKFV